MNVFFPQYTHLKNSLRRLVFPNIPDNPVFVNKPFQFFKTATGDYYLPVKTHDRIVNEIRRNRIIESEAMEAARQYVRKNSFVLDIGSNYGQLAILFSQLTGGEGQVFAFEDDDYIFALLQKNINANHCNNIRPFFRTVSDESRMPMPFTGEDFGLKKDTTAGTITIDDLNIHNPISFMNINGQRDSLKVMRGALRTIQRHRMPILFRFQDKSKQNLLVSPEDLVNFTDSIRYKIEKKYDEFCLFIPDVHENFVVNTDTIPDKGSGDGAHFETEIFNPKLCLPRPRLCKFLKIREEVIECTHFLHQNGFFSHNLHCKDWDLAHIIPEIGDGNLLDMGSSDSYILKNVSLKRIKGDLYGIDLQWPDIQVKGINYTVGDITKTPFPDRLFSNITCLSVIEHQVDFRKFVLEASRLLQSRGKLFMTFDYWDIKIAAPIKLYKLNWQPLDKGLVLQLFEECEKHDLVLTEDMDWTIQDKVINKNYYSPDPNISYTFGMAVFEKK